MKRACALALACALAAGCAELKEDVRQIRDIVLVLRGEQPAPPPPSPPPAPPPSVGVPPPEAAGMTFSGHCVGREESGYAEDVRVVVAGGRVSLLEARIDIPRRGSCSYRLADFAQTRAAPHVELAARSGSACAIRMWRQGERVTLASTDCEERCTRGAFEYAWPVQFSAAGRCFQGG